MFAFFKATEKHTGETYYSRYSAKLESKIIKHARFIKSEHGDKVLIYFFVNEVIQIIKILVKYISLREKSEKDYFAEYENKRTQSQ
jgi:hypothetical protein